MQAEDSVHEQLGNHRSRERVFQRYEVCEFGNLSTTTRIALVAPESRLRQTFDKIHGDNFPGC